MSSLNGSGQRKPDDVSFLGEISDGDSSESGDECDKGGSNFKDGNCQGSVKSDQGYSRLVDEQNSEVKDSSGMACSSGSCEGTSSTSNTEGCTVVTDFSGLMGKTEEGLCAIKSENPLVGADLSTTSKQTEEKSKGEKLSAQEKEVKDSSLDSSGDAQGNSASSGSSAALPGMTEQIAMKMEASDSKEKQEDCDSEKGSCLGDKDGVLREFVEGSLSSELVNASESIDVETKVEGTKKKDSPSGHEDDAKKGNVAMEGNEAIDLGTSVAQMDEQNCKSDSLSEEQSDSVEELTEEGLPKGNQENEQRDRSTSEEETLNQQNGDEQTKDEQHENQDMELNNEPVEDERPEGQAQIGEDDIQQTESLKDSESDSNERAKQKIQNQKTDES